MAPSIICINTDEFPRGQHAFSRNLVSWRISESQEPPGLSSKCWLDPNMDRVEWGGQVSTGPFPDELQKSNLPKNAYNTDVL